MNGFILLLPWTLVVALLVVGPAVIPALNLVVLAACAGLVATVVPRWRNPLRLYRPVLAGILAMSLGWQLAALASDRFNPLALDAARYTVQGRIAGLPEADRFGVRLRLRLTCLSVTADACLIRQDETAVWPLLVDVTVPHRFLPTPPLPGQLWQFEARPALQGEADPFNTFNLARWLKANHVIARFRVTDGDAATRVDADTAPVQMVRLALRNAIAAYEEAHPSRARLSGLPVVLALVTGDRSLMTREHWHVFNNTGTTHLIAISGSHIMLVTGVVVWLLNLLLKQWVWLTLRVPSLQVALVSGWLVAMGYGAVAGLEFPVQRALIMLTMLVLFKVWGRAQPLWLAWNTAFCLVILWDPMAVYSLGFWLSFIAVYWIIWMAGGAVLPLGKARLWARVQFGIFLGLAPVLLWQLQNLSLVSGGTNLFAIPLVGLVLTPLSLLWALGWGLFGDAVNLLLIPIRWLTEITILLLQWFADAPYSVFSTTPHDALAMLLALLGVAWLCTAGLPGRWLAPLLCLPLLVPAPAQPGIQLLRGTAAPRIVVETGEHILLVTQAEWPAVAPRWQQNLLRFRGVGVSPDLTVSRAAEYWQATGWTLTTLHLQSGLLGRDVVQQNFTDLCRGSGQGGGGLAWQVLFRNPKGTQCAVVLEWQAQRILLMTPLPLQSQQLLLEALQQLPTIQQVVLHPRKQDRLLPGLLQFWQREGTELILTELPASQWREPLDARAVKLRVLAEAGPLRLAPASP